MKHYCAPDLVPGKFYQVGGSIIEFIKDTGKVVESYPGAFSGVYLMKVTELKQGGRFQMEMEVAKAKDYPCFTEIDKEKVSKFFQRQQSIIDKENERLEFLEKFK